VSVLQQEVSAAEARKADAQSSLPTIAAEAAEGAPDTYHSRCRVVNHRHPTFNSQHCRLHLWTSFSCRQAPACCVLCACRLSDPSDCPLTAQFLLVFAVRGLSFALSQVSVSCHPATPSCWVTGPPWPACRTRSCHLCSQRSHSCR
jgi:hypothetical protein